MKKASKTTLILCCAALALVWAVMATKTFNEKPDLNGDNFYYYIYATSLATGHGYSDLSTPKMNPTSNFPPGYPLLMTPLRLITDSVVAQKWQNEVLILVGVILLFFTLLRMGMRWDVSLVAAAAGLFSPRLWHFSTMMMSEASFFCTSALVFYALARLYDPQRDTKDEAWWADLKSPWLWTMIVVLVFNYHIRIQGLALAAGVGMLLLMRRRWAALACTVVGFVVGALPYIIRNNMLGLKSNRYLDMVMMSNSVRPEEGLLTFGEVVERFFQTLKMLVFNAIPNTIFPYLDVDPDNPSFSMGIFIVGALVLAAIVIGFWSLGNIRWGLIFYLLANLGLVSIFSVPSGSRYLTTALPILAAGLFCGLWQVAAWLAERAKWHLADTRYPVALALALLFFSSADGLKAQMAQAQQRYPLPYTQFFRIGKQLKASVPEGTVVCSRKPQMLWLESGMPGVNYKFTKDARELLLDLVDRKVDYVVLDALGYSSTYLYLFPAVQAYPQLFPQVVTQYDDTHTYLLRFDRERAERELRGDR